ncbi:MAG: glutamate--cysteine ligase [Acidimicrobiia bacterium]|nr:glutamate--cysteine ligase [Acidimicrobiia bacterium]
MHIDFNASPGCSIGVEWELELVDRSTRELASAATDILTELGGGNPNTPEKAKHELFECTVEVITGICETVSEVRQDLGKTIEEVDAVAAPRGLGLMCSGTHPFSHWADQAVSPDPRFHKLLGEMQWPVRRLLIFGVHVHVGVRSPEKVIMIANALTSFLPHFLAVSASSPFWAGHDTGLASVRSKLFESLPTAGLPYQLSGWDEFEQFMDTLITSKAISSVREVWWDIRPHPDFGTVELRMCDGIPTMTELCAVTAMAQSLVDWLDRLIDRGYKLPSQRSWTVKENKWRAARHGLDAEIIVDEHGTMRRARMAVLELVEELSPVARRLGCHEELSHLVRIAEEGASYARQRDLLSAGATFPEIVDALMSEMRNDSPVSAT